MCKELLIKGLIDRGLNEITCKVPFSISFLYYITMNFVKIM